MALGGVATGSMKALLAAKAAGKINSKGGSSRPTATAKRIGTIVAVVAVLLVNSVRKTTAAVVSNTIIQTGKACRPLIRLPK